MTCETANGGSKNETQNSAPQLCLLKLHHILYILQKGSKTSFPGRMDCIIQSGLLENGVERPILPFVVSHLPGS